MATLLRIRLLALTLAIVVLWTPAMACTVFVITPGASADGSMYTGHTNDGFGTGVVGHNVSGEITVLSYVPAADHPAGAMRAVHFDPLSESAEPSLFSTSPQTPLASISEVEHTYAYFTGSYGMMNEHQLMTAETTDGAKVKPSSDPEKRIFYSSELSNIALERTRTAKDAVTLAGSLIDQYGYYGTGETLIFADPEEAWVIEMCGGTPDGRGGLWAAQRVPDGEVFVAANAFRIQKIVPGNPGQIYSANLFSVAKANGWWNESMGDLNWQKTTGYGEYAHPYYSFSRIWRLYDRIAPSRNFSPYVTDRYSDEYPFSLRPDKKLTTADAFALFRDHYEGTVFDLTTGPAAGPFGNPYRWRGPFDVNNAFASGEVKPGAWPRALSEISCGYSYITQGRSWLPDPIGGIVWYGFGPPAETVYTPFYAGVTGVPPGWSASDRSTFSRDHAWWAFNFVTNWATLNYHAMIGDIRTRQQAIEQRQFTDQQVVEKNALQRYTVEGEREARGYLTRYSTANAEANAGDWWKLSDRLVAGYSNMMESDFANGTTHRTGYPGAWLQDSGYQYGPRVYQYEELRGVADLAYVNETIFTAPGNELAVIRQTQRTNRAQMTTGTFGGEIHLPAGNLSSCILKEY